MKYENYIKSDEWKRLRDVCFSASLGRCEFCGDKAVNAHHVKYPKSFPEDEASNLVAVCRKCHDLCHGIRGNEDGKRFGLQTPSLIRKAVTLLLQDPSLAQSVHAKHMFNSLELPGADVLSEMLGLLESKPNLNMAGLLEHFRDTETGILLTRLAISDDAATHGADPAKEFQVAILKLRSKLQEPRFEELQHKARAGTLSDAEKREYAQLIQRGQGTVRAA